MGTRLREFKTTFGDEELALCEKAGIDPAELVATSVASALNALREKSEPEAEEGDGE